IVVSSQSGKLRFYDGETYTLLKTLDLGTDADADNMRYDPLSKRVYVGYGRGRGACDRRSVRHGADGGVQARQPSRIVSVGKGRAANFREPSGSGSHRGHRPQDRRPDEMEYPGPHQYARHGLGRGQSPPIHGRPATRTIYRVGY